MEGHSYGRTYIDEPAPEDVICGRGKSSSHPGNERFRLLIVAKRDEYQAARKRDEKTQITAEIVAKLRSGTGQARFLLKDSNDMWYDAGEEYAREKVSHALRSRPSAKKRPKIKKSPSRRSSLGPEMEETINNMIEEQQALLRSMIDNKPFSIERPSSFTITCDEQSTGRASDL